MNKLLTAMLTGLVFVGAAHAQYLVSPPPPAVTGTTVTTTQDTRIGTDGTRRSSATTTTRTTKSTTVVDNTRVLGAPATVTTIERDTRVIKPCPPGLAKKNNGCLPPGQARKQPRD